MIQPTEDAPRLPEAALARLAQQLPAVAERCVAEIVAQVPGYANALGGDFGPRIAKEVEHALAGFLRLAKGLQGSDPSRPMQPALDAAFVLGQGEARSGRPMDALLGAYRVGARVAWRELSTGIVAAGVDAATIARFAELVFAYIDGLSAASVAGHAEELAAEGRVRERRRERLAHELLAGREREGIATLAARAQWQLPDTLTAILLPHERVSVLTAAFGTSCLRLADEATEQSLAVVLVPDAHGPSRRRLLRTLSGMHAYVGPAKPWPAVAASHARAQRALDLRLGGPIWPVDTDRHLAELILHADRSAWTDLREQALMPLAGLSSATAERLGDTLRSWLLHQGHRDAVAQELHVHPQTVRYRMTQIRELFGDRLGDPQEVLRIIIALSDVSGDLPSLVVSGGAPPSPGTTTD